MTKAPNYRLGLALEALDPKGCELAFLELHANSEDEAYNMAQLFLRPEVKIFFVSPLLEAQP